MGACGLGRRASLAITVALAMSGSAAGVGVASAAVPAAGQGPQVCHLLRAEKVGSVIGEKIADAQEYPWSADVGTEARGNTCDYTFMKQGASEPGATVTLVVSSAAAYYKVMWEEISPASARHPVSGVGTKAFYAAGNLYVLSGKDAIDAGVGLSPSSVRNPEGQAITLAKAVVKAV